jgi:hypothetical protein
MLVAGSLLLWITLVGGWWVSQEDFERIGKGMTKAEVIQILGPYTHSNTARWPPGPNWFETVTWESESHRIEVRFSVDIMPRRDKGAVEKAIFKKESLLDHICRWLNLPPPSTPAYEIEDFNRGIRRIG